MTCTVLTAVLVAQRQVEHGVVQRVEAGQRHKLELVPELAQLDLVVGDLGVRQRALPVEAGGAVVGQQLAGELQANATAELDNRFLNTIPPSCDSTGTAGDATSTSAPLAESSPMQTPQRSQQSDVLGPPACAVPCRGWPWRRRGPPQCRGWRSRTTAGRSRVRRRGRGRWPTRCRHGYGRTLVHKLRVSSGPQACLPYAQLLAQVAASPSHWWQVFHLMAGQARAG